MLTVQRSEISWKVFLVDFDIHLESLSNLTVIRCSHVFPRHYQCRSTVEIYHKIFIELKLTHTHQSCQCRRVDRQSENERQNQIEEEWVSSQMD